MKLDDGIGIALVVFSVGLFGGGVALSFFKLTGGAVATYGAAVFVLVFVFLTRFKRFKGFGIEGELWEDKQEEAAKLIETLRGLTFTIAEPLISVSSRMGRWDSQFPRREHYALVEQIRENLTRNGMSAAEVEGMLRDWHHFNFLDLALIVTRRISEHLRRKEQALGEELNRLRQPMDANTQEAQGLLIERLERVSGLRRVISDVHVRPNMPDVVAEIERALGALPETTPAEAAELRGELEEGLEDLRHYADHRRFRRIDVWFEGDHQ